LAVALLVPGLPLIGLLMLLVRLTSRGAAIYRQARVGEGGQVFTMYKIRSMTQDAEAETGAMWTTASDARATLVGRVLRKLHLDELPQLFNVLKGEMSLVGPRPERPEFVEVLAEKIPGYLDRLAVPPGITGLAQVNLEPDTDLDSVRLKLVLDAEYIRTAGLLMDLRMFLCTLIHLMGLPGKLSRHVTGLHREVESPGGRSNGEALTPASIARQAAVEATPVICAAATAHDTATRSRFACTRDADLLNAFTVDVEDYFQVSTFERDVPRSTWDRYACRVERNTYRLLDLLDRYDVPATFFVLGWIADRYPRLVREIDAAGHEIGSHGYWHRLIYRQTPEEFREDIRRSRDVLTSLINQPIAAYRAPSFSITRQSLWALDILADEGFTVDSSIYPIVHDRYGIPGAEPGIHCLETAAGRLWEFPPSVAGFAGMKFPIGGGGYFRLYPLKWTLRGLAGVNRRDRREFMFYVHPWELDPEQPRLTAGNPLSRFRHRVNLAKTEQKLAAVLRSFRFGRLCDVIGQKRQQAQHAAAVQRSLQEVCG